MNPHLKNLINSVADTMAAMDVADHFITEQHERDSAEEVLDQLGSRIEQARQNLRFRFRSATIQFDPARINRVALDHHVTEGPCR